MLITESFTLLLDDLLHRIGGTLQITPTMHELAEKHYLSVGKWLEAPESPVAVYQPGIYPQGSLRIGTTVRPRGQDEYDLDLVCEVECDCLCFDNPVDLLDLIEERLKDNDTYKDMVERMNRCIRLNYAHQFHLDILPACPDPVSGNCCVVVPDRRLEEWKPSNPKGYADWFDRMAATIATKGMAFRIEPLPDHETIHDKPPLKRAVQLFKRWRDVWYTKTPKLAPISIVLTTLSASYYHGQLSVNDTLSEILDGIVSDIPNNGKRLRVVNPTNTSEDLSERWDQSHEAYEAFVSGVQDFHEAWKKINLLRGIDEVFPLLERLFGDEPAKTALIQQAKAISAMRESSALSVKRTSGIIGSVASSTDTRITRNTFHGE